MSDETTPRTSGGWAPKPADTLTPHQQSMLVLGRLSGAQVRAYLRSSGLPAGAGRPEAARHLAQHRVTALQEAAAFREQASRRGVHRRRGGRGRRSHGRPYAEVRPALPTAAREELASAQEVSRAAGRGWQRLSRWTGLAGFLVGWGFLVTGVVGIVPGLQFLLGVSAVCLVLASLLMFWASPALYARGQRASRAALLEWAVHRPGQLERGLPGLHKRVDEDATSGGSFCLGLISTGAGGFCAVMGMVMVPISLLDQQATSWQITGVLLGLGAVLLLSPALVGRWSRWVMHRNDAVDEAVSWVYAAATHTDASSRAGS
ncbi:hypothetical protein [Ornithinimicrobium murale]|uniref:hypothetical protein n=1 Tax=Ornithinimicrobium murale TaxID=1050153 RepID=UPI000E0CCEE1|nr:hypothetical protein [Ornithinimicrobium murale]